MTELRRYLSHFLPYAPRFLVAAALMAISAAVPAAAVLLLQQTLNDVLVAGDGDRLVALSVAFAALYVVAGLSNVARTWLTKDVAWRVTSELRARLHRRYLELAPDEQAGTGERLSALTRDVDELQYGVSAVVTAFRNPLTVLVLAITAWRMAPALAPYALVLVPIVLIPSRWGGVRLRDLGTRTRDTRAALLKLVQEQLTGLRTVQAHAAEPGEVARFAAANDADRRAILRMEVERILPSALVEMLAAVAVGALLYLGGRHVLAGTLAAGDLVGFAVALGLMNKPLSGLSEVWGLMQRSLAALEKVYATLDRVPAVREPADPVALPAGPLSIRWSGVTVDYGNGPVVRDVDLGIDAGGVLAIVGGTGEGKSTLLSLVARFRDADAGRIELGGVDVRRVSLASLRRAVGVVAQDGFLFARTVADNLALGRPDATRAEIEAAARAAGAHGFVAALPQGYDTPLAELGRSLSGGERQRLCLARALVLGAPVLLLDEATNQVDAATEREILATLDRLRGRHTIVIVAHNLSAVESADRIAVIDGGRVVEQGTHDELLRARGAYARLRRAQGREQVA